MHNFIPLYTQYAAIIALMPIDFTSHEFILRLAQQNQRLYIDALNAYSATAAPFRQVHAVLSKHLHTLNNLVMRVGDVTTPDIFGDNAQNAQWHRI